MFQMVQNLNNKGTENALILWKSANRAYRDCWASQSYSSLLIGRMLVQACLKCASGSSLPWLNCSALTHYAHDSTQRTRPPESRFDILHSPSPYKPTWAALLLKSLKLSLICAPSVRRKEAEEEKKKDEGSSMKLVGTHLTHLTLIQQSPASTHLRLPPDEASRLGWDCGGGPTRWLAWLLVLVQWLPRRSSWLDEIISCLF